MIENWINTDETLPENVVHDIFYWVKLPDGSVFLGIPLTKEWLDINTGWAEECHSFAGTQYIKIERPDAPEVDYGR